MSSRNAERTLLLVDDDADSTAPLRLLLETADPSLSILSASDGAAGVELAKTSHANIVIMDIQMPVMDGVEAAARMRENAGDRPLLLIAVSGDVVRLPSVVADSLFDYAFTKPVDLTALLRVLDLA